MKKPYPIRIDPTKYEQLKKLNIDPSKLFREFIDKILNEKECPLCGSKLKESQVMKLKIFVIIFVSLFVSKGAFAETKQLSLLGVTFHYAPELNAEGVKDMRNKITSDGMLAINPQANLTFVKDNGEMINTSVVIDCYANPAAFIGYGKKYDVEKNIQLGYVAGLYMRVFPPRDQTTFGKIGLYQILPAPALHLNYKITDKVSIRFTANYFINFFDLAFEL